jgi:hypothetical protein
MNDREIVIVRCGIKKALDVEEKNIYDILMPFRTKLKSLKVVLEEFIMR